MKDNNSKSDKLKILGVISIISITSSLILGKFTNIYSVATKIGQKNKKSLVPNGSLANLCNVDNSNFVNRIYPIGSIFMSTSLSTVADVQSALGGTWEVYGSGRTVIGVGTGNDGTNTSTFAVGDTGGEYMHTLITDNLPSHNHSMNHSNSIASVTVTSGAGGAHSHTVSINSGSNGSHNHSVSGASGAGGNHNHSWNGLLRHTGASPEYSGGFEAGQYWAEFPMKMRGEYATSWNGNHTHTLSSGTAKQGTTAATGANHTHTITGTSVSTVGNHTHTLSTTKSTTGASSATNTGATGSGTAFSVQDPYITVYMYKRIG